MRGVAKGGTLAPTRAFAEGEWSMIQTVAEGLEWSYGWEPAAAQRLRLFRQVTLVYAVAQQFARHVPGFVTRQRSVD